MTQTITTPFIDVRLSLAELVGDAYLDAVCESRAWLSGEDPARLRAEAQEEVDCFPAELQARLAALLPHVGEAVCTGLAQSAGGATSQGFAQATHTAMSPLSGLGYYRVGEDGRLYLITKSEHYHAPLGHAFPGYQLIERARRLGIANATHNNTRGHITRLLEEALVCAAHGLAPDDHAGLAAVRAADDLFCVNRVLNLETGSLATEAALKMMLARFYPPQPGASAPYAGRTPVVLVMGNDDGGTPGNYHGTTVLTQALRGMWPDFTAALEAHGLLHVCPIRPNSLDDLEAAFAKYEQPPYKIAGFFHEIIMMNYGARELTRDFLTRAYALCHAHDVPAAVDEIQSCMWAPGFFLFREYGLQPSFVIIGKGFPNGEYPASRVLFSAAMDNLPQFGALVTNGQEELASLAYLITMRWAAANTERTRRIGDRYAARLRDLAARHPRHIASTDGSRHLTALVFHTLPSAKQFVARLTAQGLDISAQTYKADCPPVVLTKLPLIAGEEVVELVVTRMEAALDGLA